MNKIPNPSYHSIHSPMATSQEGEEADTASESETMAQNKLLHSCSLRHFFKVCEVYYFFPEAMTGTAFFQSPFSSSSHICHLSWHLPAPW